MDWGIVRSAAAAAPRNLERASPANATSRIRLSPLATSGGRVSRRTIAGRNHRSTRRATSVRQIEEKHLGDEIHRVPALFAKVRHHGDPRSGRTVHSSRVRAAKDIAAEIAGPAV